MADDGDIPPLEDMSELLQKVESLRELKTDRATASNEKEGKGFEGSIQNGNETERPQASCQNVNGSHAAVPKKKEKECTPKAATSSAQQSTFGGFKKGFLFGSSPSPKVSSANKSQSKKAPKKVEEIPFIKPQNTEAKEKQFEMPEVQEAMKANQSLLDNTGWVTDDLLQRVEKNPNLMKYMADPKFSQALAEFQTNPQGAQSKYANNPEVQMFFKEFCGILGDHFSKLDVSQPTPPTGATQGTGDIKLTEKPKADIQEYNPNAPTAAEEQRMQEILSRPDVREVLMDPQIQTLIEQLRTNPGEAPKFLQTRDPVLHQKISKLVDAGLLKFQT